MITREVPDSNERKTLKLADFFYNKDNMVYPIKSDLQRKYCWTDNEINDLIEEYYFNLTNNNQDADKCGEDSYYGFIGNAIICEKQENWNNTGCPYKELIDSSQRITTTLAVIVVSLYLHMKNNWIVDPEERKKYVDSYLKTKNGKSFKVLRTFNDCDIEDVYNDLLNNTLTFNKTEVRKACSKFKPATKEGEVTYKSFRELVQKVYNVISESKSIDDTDFENYLKIFLNNTYICTETCKKEERLSKFVDVNTHRIGISNKDIYKSLLCSKGLHIDEKYQEFESLVFEIEGRGNKQNSLVKITKASYSVTEHMMKIALIYMTKDSDICKHSYSLNDDCKGIEWQLNNENGVLQTEDDVLSFLDYTIDVCNFVRTSMNYDSETFDNDWYMLTDGRNSKRMWLYTILPSYIISKMEVGEKRQYAFDVLVKSFLAYSIKYAKNRSVQYFQDYMYKYANTLISNYNSIDDFKDAIKEQYLQTFEEVIKNCSLSIRTLSYMDSTSSLAIRGILSTIEYYTQRGIGWKNKNVYDFVTGSGDIDIEHIKPKSFLNENEENEQYVADINGIGNLTLLESGLNSSKGDLSEKTSEMYKISSFLTTCTIDESNRHAKLTNDKMVKLRSVYIPYTCDTKTLNNFDIENIRLRLTKLIKSIKNFLTTL